MWLLNRLIACLDFKPFAILVVVVSLEAVVLLKARTMRHRMQVLDHGEPTFTWRKAQEHAKYYREQAPIDFGTNCVVCQCANYVKYSWRSTEAIANQLQTIF